MEHSTILGIEEQRQIALVCKIENIMFDLGTFSDLILSKENDDRPEAKTEEAYENFLKFTSRLLIHYKDMLEGVYIEMCDMDVIAHKFKEI